MKVFIAMVFLVTLSGQLSAQSNCFEQWRENFRKSTAPTTTRAADIVMNLRGCKAPHFKVRTIEGKEIDLKSLRGKVVVLNFWFSTCAPCIAELPTLNKLVSEFKGKDVVFVAFSRDNVETVRSFIMKHKFAFQQVSNEFDINDRYAVIAGWPTSMILDKSGVLRDVFVEGPTNSELANELYLKMKPSISNLLLQ